MMTRIEVNVGPATLDGLRRMAADQDVTLDEVVEEALKVWSHLRGPEERRQAIVGTFGIVIERQKSLMRGAAA